MSLADDLIQAALPPAVLAVFGDPVTLPGGAVVAGAFEPRGVPTEPSWSEVGLAVRLTAQPNPYVDLRDADAAAIATSDLLTIRGSGYQVTHVSLPDGSGLTRVELMPAKDADPFARWQ